LLAAIEDGDPVLDWPLADDEVIESKVSSQISCIDRQLIGEQLNMTLLLGHGTPIEGIQTVRAFPQRNLLMIAEARE
jgi:hypothetical protein